MAFTTFALVACTHMIASNAYSQQMQTIDHNGAISSFDAMSKGQVSMIVDLGEPPYNIHVTKSARKSSARPLMRRARKLIGRSVDEHKEPSELLQGPCHYCNFAIKPPGVSGNLSDHAPLTCLAMDVLIECMDANDDNLISKTEYTDVCGANMSEHFDVVLAEACETSDSGTAVTGQEYAACPGWNAILQGAALTASAAYTNETITLVMPHHIPIENASPQHRALIYGFLNTVRAHYGNKPADKTYDQWGEQLVEHFISGCLQLQTETLQELEADAAVCHHNETALHVEDCIHTEA